MTPLNHASLANQRLSLCTRLSDQRNEIAHLLANTEATRTAHGDFPRSMTMRLLIQRPDLIARLITTAAALFTEPRSLPSLIARLLITRLVFAIAAAGKTFGDNTDEKPQPQQFIYP